MQHGNFFAENNLYKTFSSLPFLLLNRKKMEMKNELHWLQCGTALVLLLANLPQGTSDSGKFPFKPCKKSLQMFKRANYFNPIMKGSWALMMLLNFDLLAVKGLAKADGDGWFTKFWSSLFESLMRWNYLCTVVKRLANKQARLVNLEVSDSASESFEKI